MKLKWKPDSFTPIHVSYDERYPQAWLFTLSCHKNGDVKPRTETAHVVQEEIMEVLVALDLHEADIDLSTIDDMHMEIYNMGEGEVRSFDISLDFSRKLIVTKII